MKTIEEYAVGLVADGAESTIEDDLNEDGDIADEDHEAARDLAMVIVRGIRANPALAIAGGAGIVATVRAVILAFDWDNYRLDEVCDADPEYAGDLATAIVAGIGPVT